MDGLLDQLEHFPPALIYLIAGVLVTIEAGLLIGFVLPGEATLIFLGFLVFVDTVDLGPAIVVGLVASVAGDTMGYLFGHHLGTRVRASRPGVKIGPARWDRADRFLHRFGGKAIFIGRWIPFVRTLMPPLIGSSHLPWQRWLPWSVLAAVTWVPFSILVGVVAGKSYEVITDVLGRATATVFLLVVAIVVLVFIGRWLGRHPDPGEALLRRIRRAPVLGRVARGHVTSFSWLSSRLRPTGALVVNLVIGLVLLVGIGWLLTKLAAYLVEGSGLPTIDRPVWKWFARHRNSVATDAAAITVSLVRASFLVFAVAVVGGVVTLRSRQRWPDSLGVLGTLGAFIPLIICAVIFDWVTFDQEPPATEFPGAVFPAQHAVVTAALGILAWLVSYRSNRSIKAAAWTTAAVIVVTATMARLYLGWHWPTQTIAAVLLGILWDVVLLVSWATYRRSAPQLVGSRLKVSNDSS